MGEFYSACVRATARCGLPAATCLAAALADLGSSDAAAIAPARALPGTTRTDPGWALPEPDLWGGAAPAPGPDPQPHCGRKSKFLSLPRYHQFRLDGLWTEAK